MPLPPIVQGPGGSQVYDPETGSFRFIEDISPGGVSDRALNQLYITKLKGGDFGDWQSANQARINEIQALLGDMAGAGDLGTLGMTANDLASGVPEGGLLEGIVGSQMGKDTELGRSGAKANITELERAALENELAGLMALQDQTDINLPYGSLLGPSEERQMQIGEVTGSLQDLLTQSAEKSYSNQLADLARRGITGGTAEFDLGEKQAQTSADIANQAAMLGEQIRRADYNTTMQLLSQLEAGLDADVAQSMMQQQALAGQQFGQQQLAAQQAYQQQLLAQQGQQALQNSLAALGQGLGGVNWGGLFGGGSNQTGLQQMANDPFSFLNRYPIP